MDLETVLARAEITDLLGKYCRGVDRVDEATLRSIYHEDAVEDRGEGLFIGPAHEWIGWTLGLLPAFAATHHAIQNALIEIEGDVAHGETYFTAYHRFGGATADHGAPTTDDVAWPEGGSELILAGRYLDRFERRDDVWKIAYRKMVCDWCRTQEAADGWFSENPTVYRGVRKLSDSRLGESAPR